MDALAIERAALVGCSMGAAYALDATLAAPGRTSALALISSGFTGHVWPPEMRQAVEPIILGAVATERLNQYRSRTAASIDPAGIEAMSSARARIMVAGLNRTPDDVAAACWTLSMTMLRTVFEREWTATRGTEVLPDVPTSSCPGEIAAPTLVVNGLEDLPWIRQVSDLLSGAIPNASRVDLPDTAHAAPIERPEAVTELLRDFLADAAGGQSSV